MLYKRRSSGEFHPLSAALLARNFRFLRTEAMLFEVSDARNMVASKPGISKRTLSALLLLRFLCQQKIGMEFSRKTFGSEPVQVKGDQPYPSPD